MTLRSIFAWLIVLGSGPIPLRAGESEQFAAELQAPFQIQVGNQSLDVGRSGHSSPFFADLDGDGRRDLLVGHYADGRVRLYRNEGTNKKPQFSTYEYIMADGEPASVPVFCCIGFTPQLIDLDGDGRDDLLSGSAPGEFYLFRRRTDGGFRAGEKLTQPDGKELTAGSIATAFAVDWTGDDRLDLVLGNVMGEVHLSRNVSRDGNLSFDSPEKIELDDPRKDRRESAPVAADWNGDGQFDLVVGMEDGSVYWFRNIGERGKPKFASGECLVAASQSAMLSGNARGLHDCGQRIKMCVADFNDDDRLDLLLGDFGGSFRGKPEQTPAEVREEADAIAALPQLRATWAKSYSQYRKLAKSGAVTIGISSGQPSSDKTAIDDHSKLLDRVKELKAQIDEAETIVKRYEEQDQTHGYVWVLLRKPVNERQRQFSAEISTPGAGR